jgi:CO dehydrogenase maturation factor
VAVLTQESFKIAISGKGGVGKTTLCAVWSRLLAEDGLDVLAIDADSDPNLAMALGMKEDDRPKALIEMKDLIRERTGAEPGAIGQYFKMNPHVADLPGAYCREISGVKLLVLGGIANAGSGCACPESAFLKSLLTHSLLHRREVILVDLAAGVEFMGRACIQGVDALVVVVEPGRRSIETAINISNMARQMGIEKVAAFVNKTAEDSQIEQITEQLGDIVILGSFGYDSSLQRADMDNASVFDSNPGLVEELRRAKNKMLGLFFDKAIQNQHQES